MKNISLNTAFKKYGKENMVRYINDYHSDRINVNMSVDKIIYTLESYELVDEIEEHLNGNKGNSDLYGYNIFD